jgi:hypothetical protein
MRLAHKHNRCIGIVVWLGVGIVLATIVEPSFVWAKGGGMSPKPPTPFTREELILIDKCRFLARSRGTDSPVFARECATVRPYLNHWAWPPCICSVYRGRLRGRNGAWGQVVAMPRPGQCWKLRPVFQLLLSSAAEAGDKREKNLTARMHDAANNIRTTI